MIKFGIPQLDKEFDGIERSTILTEGVSGCGKMVLGYHLIDQVLKRGEPLIVVTSSRSPEELKSDLDYYKMESKGITWIETAGETLKGENVIQSNLGELFTVTDVVKKQIVANQGKDVTIVLDAVSSALMSNSVQQVYKFFTGLTQEFKKSKVTAFVLMELQMHDSKDVAAIEHLCDTVLEFIVKSEDRKKGFLIKKKGGRPVPDNVFDFELTDKGLEIK